MSNREHFLNAGAYQFLGYRKDALTDERFVEFEDTENIVDVLLYEQAIRTTIADTYRGAYVIKPFATLTDVFDLSRFDQPVSTPANCPFSLKQLQLMLARMYGREDISLLAGEDMEHTVLAKG